MAIFRAFIVAALFSTVTVVSSPIKSTVSYEYAVKDVHRAPRGWTKVGQAPNKHILHVSIGLQQSRFHELERILYQVSDPAHSSYGQYLADEQVYDLIKPTDEALSSVTAWLTSFGFDPASFTYSPARDWINLEATVGSIEELLETKYSIYEKDDSVLVRTQQWSLPVELHKHITTIQPTNSFARLNGRRVARREIQIEKRNTNYRKVQHEASWGPSSPQQSGAWGDWPSHTAEPYSGAPHTSTTAPPAGTPTLAANANAVAAACNFSLVTPLCLRTLYGTLSYTPQVPGKNKMGHTNYLEEYSNRSDISIFLQKYRPEAAAVAYEFPQVSIAGGNVDNGTNTANNAPDKGLEANLDSETMLGIGWPTPLTVWSTGGRNPSFVADLQTPTNSDEPYLVWAQYLTGQPQNSIPQVISTSYGDDEQTVSKSYAEAVCNQFAQLGAKGVSLLFASGDYGVGPDGLCFSSVDNTTAEFLPSFPNNCPYVTSVGATTLFPETAAYDPFADEPAYTSGAGFSNYFPQPAYQAEIVQEYVTGLGGLHKGLYNPNGRAYPDISCNGQRYNNIWNGSEYLSDGTSASTPACSAILALVNDALIAKGRPALGFLNPWLYKSGYKLFTDIINGTSAGCNTTGFPAKAGWDAVTGFGTPYFPRLLYGLNL